MRILILGGTKFLGRHLVDCALKNGHEVTLFNRGLTNPGLYPEVETLVGDRDGNLEALRGRHWDVVIDPSGYLPRVVRQSVELLKDSAEHYTFVSSVSVYVDFTRANLDEDAAVGTLEDKTSENIPEHYGELKALCEQEVKQGFGERALVIRPGLIVGPHDPTDRFTYWVWRFAQGGDVLVPGRYDYPVQFIDVRDLADWMIKMAEGRAKGTFNATGPDKPLNMKQFVDELVDVIPSAGHPIWVNEEFLLSQGVEEWTELPLWISDRTGWPGFQTVNVSKAVKAGLTFHSVRDTILDTLQWERSREKAGEGRLKAGLSHERELELLHAWNQIQL